MVSDEGPSFKSEFDLIALNDEGVGVSAVTVWLPGPGTCGVVEPMGTSREYQRQGHGRRVLLGTQDEWGLERSGHPSAVERGRYCDIPTGGIHRH